MSGLLWCVVFFISGAVLSPIVGKVWKKLFGKLDQNVDQWQKR